MATTWTTIAACLVAVTGAAWIAFASFWAELGFYSVDGLMYLAMADAFARDGSFFVWNGYEEYGAEPLRLLLMHPVDGRLAPQYPGGWGILAAPAYLAGGLRGVFVLNAAASALTLALVWLTAQKLFGDRSVAAGSALIYGLATFAVDYAVGFWPHGVSTFLITAAVYFAAPRAGDPPEDSRAERRGALFAGLLLGLAVNIRVEALIAAVPLGVWLLAAGRRPYCSTGLLVAGLLPGLAVATAINAWKFGIPSPATYGRSEGATSLAYYSALAPLAAIGALGILALGQQWVRAALSSRLGAGLAVLAGVALILILPGAKDAALRIARGAWVLLVNFQDHPTPARGVTVLDDGSIRMFGLVKKALLESLPYAAAILVLVPRLSRGPGRVGLRFLALFVALGIVPFAFANWHGGQSSNMRYFLILAPAIAILSAVALGEIWTGANRRGAAAVCLGSVVAAVGATVAATERGVSIDFFVLHSLPSVVIAATAGLALIWLASWAAPRRIAATVLAGVAAFGLATAFVSAYVFDLQIGNHRRAVSAQMVVLTQDLPGDALVVTYAPDNAGFRLNQPPALTAAADFVTREVGEDVLALIATAFAEGRPVFAQGHPLARQILAAGAASRIDPRYGVDENFELYELSPPGDQDR